MTRQLRRIFRHRFLGGRIVWRSVVLLALLAATLGDGRAEGSFQVGLKQPLYEEGFTSSLIDNGDRPLYVDILAANEVINVAVCGQIDGDNVSVEIYDTLGVLAQTFTLGNGNVACKDPFDVPLIIALPSRP
ncbi:MAG: hypothetical protein JSV80_11415 [Acidobacteriota bacterium]|nr:MAG: hypothetical protein JSV80_11415 [Acidobacteriota bacterium]